MKKLLIILFLLIVNACAKDDVKSNNQGQATEYTTGYADGCATARAANSDDDFSPPARKDKDRFKNQALYMQGWDEGFEKCTAQYR